MTTDEGDSSAMGSLFGGGGSSSYQQPQVETSAYPGTVRPRMDVANDRAALGLPAVAAAASAPSSSSNLLKPSSTPKSTIATKTTLGDY